MCVTLDLSAPHINNTLMTHKRLHQAQGSAFVDTKNKRKRTGCINTIFSLLKLVETK